MAQRHIRVQSTLVALLVGCAAITRAFVVDAVAAASQTNWRARCFASVRLMLLRSFRMSSLFRMARVGGISIAIGLLPATGASAQIIFNVDSTLDQLDANTNDNSCNTGIGTCTLRAATMQANRLNADITIVLPAGTYALTQSPTNDDGGGAIKLTTPAIGNPLITIKGAGAASTIIDAGAIADRVLSVEAGRRANVSGVSIVNGKSGSQAGGGISNVGNLRLSDSTVADNSAVYTGGGIDNEGTLAATHLTLTGNKVLSVGGPPGLGGGILNSGSLVMTQSTLSANTACVGGGIYSGGPSTLTLVAFVGNHAMCGQGGGIANSATMTLDQCTLSGNEAAPYGGGISSASGTSVLTMMRTTVSGNTAEFGGGISSSGSLFASNSTISGNSATRDGGGIYNWNSGTSNIYNTTIVNNEADSDFDSVGSGAGLYNDAGATFNLRNSVVANNSVQVDHAYEDCHGALNSYGRNKFSDAVNGNLGGCAITQTGPGNFTLLSSQNELGPLQNNGGPTLTHAIVSPSDMIDGAEATVGCIGQNSAALATDQRGRVRVGARCDIGAFEYGSSLVDEIFADGFE